MSQSRRSWSAAGRKQSRCFPLYPKQAEFLDSPSLYRGFVGGRGSGKSKIGAYDMWARACPGRLYMIGAPTVQMLKDATLRSFEEVGQQIGRKATINKVEMVGHLDNGAEILFRSAHEPERFRGPNLSGMWLDEASVMAREAFEIGIACLRESGGEEDWFSATFTPKGRLHWTYEVFGEQRKENTSLTHAHTLDNPFLSQQFYESVKDQYSGLLARQELGGEFVDTEGAEWPAEYFDRHIWFDEWPKTFLRVLALDPSKGKDAKFGDYSAFVLLGLDHSGGLWVDADLARRPTPQIVVDGIAILRRWQPQAFVIETNQFQELLASEFLQAANKLRLAFPGYKIDNHVNKQVRIRTLGPLLAQKRMRFKGGSKGAMLLVEQLRAFPEGDHDDGPDSLEMATRMMNYLLGQRFEGQPVILAA